MSLTASGPRCPTDDHGQAAWDHEAVVLTAQGYTPGGTGSGLVARGLYVGTGGNVVLVSPAGNTATYFNVPSGYTLAVAFSSIVYSGTTASQMVALA